MTALVSDAGDDLAIQALIAGVKKQHDGIDVHFLNAGIGQFGSIVGDSSFITGEELVVDGGFTRL